MVERNGQEALAYIDQVLAQQPVADGGRLSAATVCLAAYRDQLVTRARSDGMDTARRHQLGHVNAIITAVLAVQFPLGEVPWQELRKARAWLAEALALAPSL